MKLYDDARTMRVTLMQKSTWASVLNDQSVKDFIHANNDGGGGMVMVDFVDVQGASVPANNHHLRYGDMKRVLRKQESLAFVCCDHVKNVEFKKLSECSVKHVSFVVRTGDQKYFLGERSKFETTDDVVQLNCVSLIVRRAGEEPVELLMPVFEDEKKIMKEVSEDVVIVSGMWLEHVHNSDSQSGAKIMEIDKVLLATEVSSREESFEEVKSFIANVKCWEDLNLFFDISNGSALYEQIVNEIILMNVLYVKTGEPVFNVTLSGQAGTAKSSCAKLYATMLSEDGTFIAGNMSTTKGMVPSYGEKPSPGMLMVPINYFKMVDEVFRRAVKEAYGRGMVDVTPHVYNYLMDLMNVVERAPNALAGSGQGRMPKGIYMRDSFMGTDNLQPEVRNALCKVALGDKAVMRRFTFLLVTEADSERVRSAKLRPSSVEENVEYVERYLKAKGLSAKGLKGFSRWFRKTVRRVKVDGWRCKQLAEKVMRDILNGMLSRTGLVDFAELVEQWIVELNIIPFIEGFVRCAGLMRIVFTCTEERLLDAKEVDVCEADYQSAERYAMRLFEDTFSVYKDAVVGSMRTEGIDRVNSGVIR